MSDKNKNSENVVSLSNFRQKKKEEETLTRGRKPLYVSQKDGKVTGSPHLNKGEKDEDFAQRVSRIKSSLERINSLMSELKKMSANDNKKESLNKNK